MFQPSPFPTPDLFPPGEATDKLKTAFAAAMLRSPENAFVAGCTVFGSDTGKALYVSNHWINDEFVLAEQTRLLKTSGARAFLPSREEYARRVWEKANDPRTPGDDQRYLLNLYGDIMGYKTAAEKPGVKVDVTMQSVMVVKDHGSDDNWEKKAKAQQHQLAKIADESVTDVDSRTVH